MRAAFGKLVLITCMLVGLPLCGVMLAGLPVDPYLEFPPSTRYVEPGDFSWPAFIVILAFVTAVCFPFLFVMLSGPKACRVDLARVRPFPWWGWCGVAFLALAWVFAWTRFPWFESLQPFTFTPLWLGYIVIVNALTFKRTGHCMMRDHPGFFLSLFPLSGLFWWFFEYLNRFVQNWSYVSIDMLGPVEYVVHATLPFSTVLPAVLSTLQCLESFPHLDRALRDLWPTGIPHQVALGWVVLLVAGGGLMGIGVWPDYLFALVWISPLLIILSIQMIFREETFLARLEEGDWRPVWLPAMAGLICGFFWELWNSQSLAHWVYTVPFVHDFKIFEMPILGYAGYLPFGLECVVVASLLPRRKPKTGLVT
ncbi:MAG: hypothetical protein V3S25_09245 [Nitrospirales bacterium]